MAKNPSFSFYTSDFLTETTFLSFEDKGKLITLFCLQHQLGHLSKEQIQKVCGDLSAEVMNFFQLDAEGKYFCEKIDIAKEKRKNFINKQKNNISKRWNKFGNTKPIPNEYQTDTINGKGLEIPLENENEIENEIEKDNEEEKTEKGNKVVRKKGKPFIKPTKKEVLEFAKAEQLRTDLIDEFIDHYDSIGWRVGKAGLPMRDWKASYRGWCRRQKDIPKNKSSGKNEFLEMLKEKYPEEVNNIFPDNVVDTEGVEQ